MMMDWKDEEEVYDVAQCQRHTAQLARTTRPSKARATCADLRSGMKTAKGIGVFPQGATSPRNSAQALIPL